MARDGSGKGSRRGWLRGIGGWAAAQAGAPLLVHSQSPGSAPKPAAQTSGLFSKDDEGLLHELEKANFQYFWEQTNPQTGLVRDRARVRGAEDRVVASIAATGFGLTALAIGAQRGFLSEADAYARVLATLHFLWRRLPNHRGFFFHFANVNTGERLWDSEVSSVDTAILICGVLMCCQAFYRTDIRDLAYEIVNRVNWTWLSEDTLLLPHGWVPEGGCPIVGMGTAS